MSIAGRVAKTGAITDSGRGAVRSRTVNDRSRGKAMAQQEMKAAEETYAGFISLFKIGSIITAVVVIGVVLLIAS
ncbi:MAG TPA: aa3-type cytochrome c oxidase subunit IV [Variovorax sp.]|nr:aa3-type cytochrome c oxidase subunit IV [Variovorax sp.]